MPTFKIVVKLFCHLKIIIILHSKFIGVVGLKDLVPSSGEQVTQTNEYLFVCSV